MTEERNDELRMELLKLTRKQERAQRALLKDQFVLYGISEVWDEGRGWSMFPDYTTDAHIESIQMAANKRVRKSARKLREIDDEINKVHSELYVVSEDNGPYLETSADMGVTTAP